MQELARFFAVTARGVGGAHLARFAVRPLRADVSTRVRPALRLLARNSIPAYPFAAPPVRKYHCLFQANIIRRFIIGTNPVWILLR